MAPRMVWKNVLAELVAICKTSRGKIAGMTARLLSGPWHSDETG